MKTVSIKTARCIIRDPSKLLYFFADLKQNIILKIQLIVTLQQYKNDDICMFDLLASIQVDEIEKAIGSKLSVEDVFELYVESMKWSDGDTFIHRREDCQDEVL